MTALNKDGVRWRHTSVLIRADIFAQALERGLNISHECNQVLADLVGIDYRQQQLPEETPVTPVIVASEEKAARATREMEQENRTVRPVLNAEDPKTPGRVLQQKKEHATDLPPKKSTVPPGSEQQKELNHPPQSARPGPSPRSQNKKKAELEKRKGRETAIRRFVSTKVVRTDAEGSGGGTVPKDEMYQRFVRWCKVNSVSPVPDKRSFSVALKNRFVIRETTVNDVPCWADVAMK